MRDCLEHAVTTKEIFLLINLLPYFQLVCTQRLRKINSKINDYVIELLREEHEFDRKLRRQFWRNKDKLRVEKSQLEDLRKKFANISQNLYEDVEYLERGYFTFGNNIKVIYE